MALAGQFCCLAQDRHFTYESVHKDSLSAYIDAMTEKKIRKFTGRNLKDIRETLEERKKDFKKGIADSTYIFDRQLDAYLNSVLRRVYAANPELPKQDFYFFIDKSPIPNAACYGNGIFTVNLGLFHMVETDDEMAFILCHEIGHYALEHSDKSMLRYVESMRSDATRKKVREVKRKTYGRMSAYRDLMKELSYNFNERSRADEMQADSIGHRLYARTGFAKGAGVSALRRLKESDSLVFSTDSRIREHFSFPNYPFKESWLAAEQTLFDLDETADDYAMDKDSLSSHPEIPARIARLRTFGTDEAAGTASEALKAAKKRAAGNTVMASVDASRVDIAFYQVMTLYDQGEMEEPAYCAMMASLLKRTYDIKLQHTFGKYVPALSPFSEEKHLNEVRTFLHRLELKNIRKIGHEFCQKYAPVMKGNRDFQATASFFKNLNP